MWTTSEHLLAASVDLLTHLRWMYYEAHRAERAPKLPLPTSVPRPGLDAAASPTPAYVSDNVPVIAPDQVGAWLST